MVNFCADLLKYVQLVLDIFPKLMFLYINQLFGNFLKFEIICASMMVLKEWRGRMKSGLWFG